MMGLADSPKQCIWSHVPLEIQCKLLLEFSDRFFEDDVDDPALNHALLDAFLGDFHLCKAFKTLFVYCRNASVIAISPKFDNLPAWALQSRMFHILLPIVLPDLKLSDEKVVFENELQ